MASIHLQGILVDSVGEIDVGGVITFTHLTTTGETIASTKTELIIPPDGTYSIDVEYGQIRIDYTTRNTERFVANVIVNSASTATSLPELLSATTPVAKPVIIQMQGLVADAVTAQEAAEAAAATTATRKDTFANLIALSPAVDGTTFICQERANAEYILQPSGYVALAGDATFANGRVAALQIDGPALSGWFATVQDAVDRTNSVLLTDDYTNSSPLSINCISRDFTLDGGGHKLTSDTAGNISAFGDLLHEEAVTSSTASTITVSASNSLITYITANIENKPVIKIISDDVIDAAEDANERLGEFARVVSVVSGVITLESSLYFTYTTSPRIFALVSGKLLIKDLTLDVTSLATVDGTHIFSTKLMEPEFQNIEILKGNDAGIVVRSCYKARVINPSISNLTDDTGANNFGYGVDDSSSFNTRVINGNFSNTRHAYTTNTAASTVGGPPDNFGATMFGEVVNCSSTDNNEDAFDTHPNAYFTVFNGVTGYKNKKGLVKDRGKFTKVVNPVSDGDAFTVRSSARSDNLTIINPVSINSSATPLFFDPDATSNVFIDGGMIEKVDGNEFIRFTNCNVTGSLNVKYTGATDFTKMIKMTNSTVDLSSVNVDLKQSTSSNIRIVEITSGGANIVKINNLSIAATSGANAISIVSDLTGTGTNIATIRNSLTTDAANLSGLLAQGSSIVNAYDGGTNDGFFVTITATDQGISELTNNGNSLVSLIVAVTGGTKSLVALPDGLFVAQKLKITMSKNSDNFFKVRHGPTYNTDLISGADVTLVPGESISLFWNGSDWEEFTQSN